MANYDLTYEGSRVQGILDTGDELRDAGYIFRGEATPSTVPGTPTERVAYIGGPGTYTNFGSSITVPSGSIGVFKYTGSAWSNEVIACTVPISTSVQNNDTTVPTGKAVKTAVDAEASARQLGDSTLQGGINTVSAAITAINNAIGNGCVYAGIATPSSTPASGRVFYLALTAGTYTNFNSLEVPQGINILKNNGSTWLLDSFLGIDDAPTQGSANLVKSGGVLNSIIQNGPAFDLSAYNAQGGTLATYADLSAALTALNALPADFKKGGMSMKFVLSSDNKYVQYTFLLSGTFTVSQFCNPVFWQENNFLFLNEDKLSVFGDSVNLFNIRTITPGYWADYSGGLSPLDGWNASDYIVVEEGKTYSLTQLSNCQFYDANKGYVDVITDNPFTVPSGVKYVRLSIQDEYLEGYMMNEGSILLPYSEYNKTLNIDSFNTKLLNDLKSNILSDAVRADVEQNLTEDEKDVARNNIDAGHKVSKNTIISILDDNLFNIDTLIYGHFIGSDGIPVGLDGYNCTDFIPVDSGCTYKIAVINNAYLYDENKIKIEQLTTTTFTVPNNAKYARFSMASGEEDSFYCYKKISIKLLGDSITYGYGLDDRSKSWAGLLKSYFENKYFCEVTNEGVSGITSEYLVENKTTLITGTDDVAICLIGTNNRIQLAYYDALYGDLETLYNYCKGINVKFVLMSPPPATITDETTGNYGYMRPKHIEDINHVISLFSANNDIQYIDIFEPFERYVLETGIELDTLFLDGLHPNEDGHYIMYRIITKGLGIVAKIKGATW